jgi:hypothetical protein
MTLEEMQDQHIRQTLEGGGRVAATPPPSSWVHYTQVGPMSPGSRGEKEWAHYLRELPALLAAGKAGQFALVKGDEVIGLFSTRPDAQDEGNRRWPGQLFAVFEVREWEPVYKLYSVFRCRS